MLVELTINEAKQSPVNFLYCWVNDEFLAAIPSKYANIIAVKRANQRKLLMLSAKKYLGSADRWTEYTDAIRSSFIDAFGMTPVEALVKLAQGQSVAGKNWKEGVFGVGAIKTTKFKGTDITVNKTNGYMQQNGKYLPVYDTVYGEDGNPYQQFYYDETTGKTYMSQLAKNGKWYASAVSDNRGVATSEETGSVLKASDSATVWETVILKMSEFLEWLINLFSGSSSEKETLQPSNTLPSQTEDGFATEQAGFGEIAALALVAVAGGMLLLGDNKKKK